MNENLDLKTEQIIIWATITEQNFYGFIIQEIKRKVILTNLSAFLEFFKIKKLKETEQLSKINQNKNWATGVEFSNQLESFQ